MASTKEKQTHSEHKENERERSPRDQMGNKDKAGQQTGSGRQESERQKSNRQKKHEFKLSPGESAKTTDHQVIQQWIEERGGVPATVAATEGKSDPGLLRIDFPGRGTGRRLEQISWDEFFKKFDEKHLAFLYQEQTRTGRVSRFSKFVSSEDEKSKS